MVFMRQEIDMIRTGVLTACDLLMENGKIESLDDECRRVSILTLLELSKLNIFDHLVLLESFSNREEKFKRNPSWFYHCVSLVGNGDKWFVEGHERSIGPVILNKAIWQLTEIEGCTWPDFDSVQRLVMKGRSTVEFREAEECYVIPTLVYEDGQVLPISTLVSL